MSKIKTKTYVHHKEFVDKKGNKRTVLVCGKLNLEHTPFGQLKTLNFGHALCSPDDHFDLETGVKLAEKRLYRDPLITYNHNFLNEDMIAAILENEVEYIIENIEKYLPKKKEA